MDNKPTYEELMTLYLIEKEEKEKIETELKDALETINELSKLLEDKNIKLAKQLCERFGIKSDKKEVVVANEALNY